MRYLPCLPALMLTGPHCAQGRAVAGQAVWTPVCRVHRLLLNTYAPVGL